MTDELDLMQLAASGDLLATVDGVTYRAVQIVFADSGGVPRIYCRYQDWASMPAAKLAARDREIAELTATLERQAMESLKQCQRAVAAEARVKELETQLAVRPADSQAAYLNGGGDTPPPDPVPCPDCGETFKNARAVRMHQQRAHQGMQTPMQQQAAQFVEPLGWRCKAKGCSGAHAQDLHDTAFCTLHASPRTNGRELTTVPN